MVCRRRISAVAPAVMGLDVGAVVGAGPPVVKAPSDKRLYEVLKLPNGLSALLIHDPAMSGLHPEDDDHSHGACDHDHDEDDDDEDTEEGEDDDDDDEGEDGDEGMEVDGTRGLKRGHKACCSNGTFHSLIAIQAKLAPLIQNNDIKESHVIHHLCIYRFGAI